MSENEKYSLMELVDSLSATRRSHIIEILDHGSRSQKLLIKGARSHELATENQLVFCKSEDAKLINSLQKSQSRFIVCRPDLLDHLSNDFIQQRVFILTLRPRLLLASLLAAYSSPPSIAQQKTAISPAAKIANGVLIGPGVVIGEDVEIGSECVIEPNTVITHATIGCNTLIGANCRIGGEGFGYEIDEESGEVIKFPHFGRAIIGNRVEIFSNSCVARGSLKDTIIEDNVKIDNLVHVAHNCHIKQGAMLIANAMIGGSVTIGENAWVAPSTALLNGISLGDYSMTGMSAVVTKMVGENELVVGVPARKIRNRFPDDFPL